MYSWLRYKVDCITLPSTKHHKIVTAATSFVTGALLILSGYHGFTCSNCFDDLLWSVFSVQVFFCLLSLLMHLGFSASVQHQLTNRKRGWRHKVLPRTSSTYKAGFHWVCLETSSGFPSLLLIWPTTYTDNTLPMIPTPQTVLANSFLYSAVSWIMRLPNCLQPNQIPPFHGIPLRGHWTVWCQKARQQPPEWGAVGSFSFAN